MNGNEIDNAVIQPLATAPANANLGQIYVNSSDKLLYLYDGEAWQPVGAVVSVNGKTGAVVLTKSDIGLGNVDNTSDATKKANFTGSIADNNDGFVTGDEAYDALAGKQAKINVSGILKGNGSGGISAAVAGTDYGTYSKPSGGIPKSDLATAVQNLLDGALQKSGGTMSGDIAMGSNKITGLADGTNAQDAVTVSQLSSAVSTNTAFFRGSYATKAALTAVSWQTTNSSGDNYVTNNDYAVVLADESKSGECWRYTYTTGSGWAAQYRINEAPLTSAQQAALDSGITSTLVALISENRNNIAAILDGSSIDSFGDVETELAKKAPVNSPTFTGSPKSVTPTSTSNDTSIATTAFVKTAIAGISGTVKTATGTISTTKTSASVSFTGALINAYATMGGAIVQLDISIGSNAVTFTTAEPPSATVTCVVAYV